MSERTRLPTPRSGMRSPRRRFETLAALEEHERREAEEMAAHRQRAAREIGQRRDKLRVTHQAEELRTCRALSARSQRARVQLEKSDARLRTEGEYIEAAAQLTMDICSARRALTARQLQHNDDKVRVRNDAGGKLVEEYRVENSFYIPPPPRPCAPSQSPLLRALEKDAVDLPAISHQREAQRTARRAARTASRREHVQRMGATRDARLEEASARVTKEIQQTLARFVRELKEKEVVRIRAARFQAHKRDPVHALAVDRLEAEYAAQET